METPIPCDLAASPIFAGALNLMPQADPAVGSSSDADEFAPRVTVLDLVKPVHVLQCLRRT